MMYSDLLFSRNSHIGAAIYVSHGHHQTSNASFSVRLLVADYA
jgi:hypothetical protein